jgi:DNA topoisomerase-1
MRGLDMLKSAVRHLIVPHTYREKRRVASGWRYIYDKFKAPYVAPLEKPAPKSQPKGKAVFIHGIRIAPAYKVIWQAPNADAELVAIVRDAKGRRQYLYSARHWEKANAAKFEHAAAFMEVRPQLEKKIVEALGAKDQTTRQCAEALYLISKAAIRVGSTKDTLADKKAYGATTLEGRHVSVKGEDVRLRFVAKKGVAVDMTLKDAQLALILGKRKGKDDARLWPHATAKLINEMISHWTKVKATAKSFRTATGTETAMEAIRGMRVPKSKKAKREAINIVCDRVAARLGNTRSVARASYINPAVWAVWGGLE